MTSEQRAETEALLPSAPELGDVEFLAAMGRKVREIRERGGMARKVLSQKAGVSERYLAQLEAGEGNASVLLLRNVARALGMPVAELIDPPGVRTSYDEVAARKKRIALIGLRGAGKSTLGAALAKGRHVPFVELDREIEREAGMGLSEIFLLYGQAGYRRIERRCLGRTLEAHPEMVMTVGGGIVSEPEAFRLLLRNCLTVWVKATPDEHMARVVAQGDLRPMQGRAEAMQDLNKILETREPLYKKADATIDTSGERPDQSLRKLREAVSSSA
jgi:XRE family aerobic/anaerobic benzoate catabolism transcriptional regulator